MKTFENEFLHIQVEDLPNCMVKLTCELKEALTKSVEGKEALLSEALKKIIELSKLPFLKIDSKINFDLSKENTLILELPIEPKVPKIDYSKLSLPKIKKPQISPDDVEQALEEKRYEQAIWKDLPHQPIKEGDFVDLRITEILSKRVIIERQRFLVDKEVIAPWIYSQLLGKRNQESFQAEAQIDPKAPDQVKQNFIPQMCEVTILGVKQVILPDLNSDFARKLGSKAMPLLRQRMKKALEERADLEYLRQLKDAILGQLLQTHPFEVPQLAIEKQKNIYIAGSKNQAVSDEDLTKRAENFVRAHYLFTRIAGEEKIQVSEKEIRSHLKGGESKEQVDEAINNIMHNKSMNILITKIKRKNSKVENVNFI